MFKNKISTTQKIETIIGKETVLGGNLTSKGSVRIDGSFKGDLFSRSDVIIGEDGFVQAKISCVNAILAGRIEGNIKTEGKLDIRATGVLIGDAEVGSLTVEDGAVLTGRCVMKLREDKRAGKKEFKPSLIAHEGSQGQGGGSPEEEEKKKESALEKEKGARLNIAAGEKGQGKKK